MARPGDAESPKPGGNSDSGELCPSAGIASANRQAPVSAIATLFRKGFNRDHLLDARLRLFLGLTGQNEHTADNHDEQHSEDHEQTGHETCQNPLD